MNISFWLNGVYRQEEIEPGMLLIDFLREKGCYSVKRGCETANCGLCTVLVEDRPILSCSTLAARIDGKKVVTLLYDIKIYNAISTVRRKKIGIIDRNSYCER